MKRDQHGLNYKSDDVFLETILSDAPFGVVCLDASGVITLVNRQAYDLLELSGDFASATGRNFLDCISGIPELHDAVKDSVINPGRSFQLESIPCKAGYVNIRSKPLLGACLVTIQNITSLRETESRILAAMIKGQEDERKRMSGEIHDGIGPLLSAVRINIESILFYAAGSLGQRVVEDLSAIIGILDETIRDLRTLSHNLVPGILEDFGLVPALKDLCDKFGRPGQAAIRFNCNFEDRLDEKYELALYRIAQELVNNAVRHSGAAAIHVQLIRHPDHMILAVEDNGKGMFPGDQTGGGIGLKNVSARVKALGGNLMIDSKRDKGCSVTVEIPINGQP